MEDILPQELIDIIFMFCDENLLVKAIKEGDLQKIQILSHVVEWFRSAHPKISRGFRRR